MLRLSKLMLIWPFVPEHLTIEACVGTAFDVRVLSANENGSSTPDLWAVCLSTDSLPT